ncbi:MAG: HD family phosphohydrolase [Phocaeicola sp.]|uniref:HD family phosphohydrolase n=1 Tax=Phocaeicola TaxID=909656 RepID=UPI00234F2282|nr:HDIG domain-containing metalloprotein [Phocaeicola oris]MCE2616949.1 HDIG domain-containing protein [Phocaeicola oris]
MRSSDKKRKIFSKDFLYKILIFVFAVTVIVYFLPKGSSFNYQFEINRPWRYGLLQAMFDFPIYKNDEQVQKEQDSIMTQYQPYFHIDNSVEKDMLSKLKADYEKVLKKKLPNHEYYFYIERMLHMIYQDGIISVTDLEQMEKNNVKSIRLVNENTAISFSLSQFLSSKQAYEQLLEADTTHYKKEILQQCDLNDYITPNLVYNADKSEEAKKDLLSTVSWANGYVLNGQKIIDRGEIVNEQTFNILESLKKEWSNRSSSLKEKQIMTIGQALFVGILLMIFMIYLELFRKEYYQKKNTMLLLISLIIIFPVIAAFALQHNIVSIYVVPFAMSAIFISIFLDSRTAMAAQIIIILLSSIPLHNQVDFIMLQIVASYAAIFSLRELSQRSQLFQSAFIVLGSYCLTYFSLELTRQSGTLNLNIGMYVYFVINSVLLLFTYPLLYLVEKLFGFTSNVTLVELSNINNPLLRELSEVAPGTFQHSLQMSNLAAAAANKIGAKAQLVRTGALYHDIGKMVNPAFFTENQSGFNPHKKLTYMQSAKIIISHVTDGYKLAEKHRLPLEVKNFIPTHHGRGVTKYFYIMYKNEHPNEEIDDTPFRYPGPNPYTKEQAILMMADAIEATSRSLKEYTEESISNLVDKIIDAQVDEGFFKECPITFADIANVKELFKEKLKTMYHTRISYPELKGDTKLLEVPNEKENEEKK